MKNLPSQMVLDVERDAYCTFAWAAERLGCSVRTVSRYVEFRMLTTVTPKVGTRESKRHKVMLHIAEVEKLHRARQEASRARR